MARATDRGPEGGGGSRATREPEGEGGSRATSQPEGGALPNGPSSPKGPVPAPGGAVGGATGGATGGAARVSAFRTRILPRSLLGVASLILAFAIGAGFSGVVLYSYYQYKLNQTDQKVNALINGYKGQFAKAEANLNADVAAAKANVAAQLKAVQQQQAGPEVLAALIKQVAPSVFFVHTLDSNGQASVGTAFVVSSNATQSLLLTSYTTVAAATHSPGPPVYVRQANGSDVPVTVRTWDTQYDLALLVVPRGNLTKLVAAPNNPTPQPGDRLFAVSGLASAGAKVTQGAVVDVSASGLEIDAAIGSEFQGGPLVTQAGEVAAVASRTYSPLGFTTNGVWYVPYVEAACNKVLSCPGGSLVGSH